MEQVSIDEPFAAFVGIDWADAKHDLCLQADGCERRESSTLEHTAEAIAAWASALRRRFGGKLVAICLELNKGPLQAAVRTLAFKWIRTLFRCWQNRRLYDEPVYLRALQKRGSPLLKHLASSTRQETI